MSRRAFTNWSRHHRCWPARWSRPDSVEAVAEALAAARAEGLRVKVVGSGHSWSDIACSDGVMLELDGLRGVMAIDRAAMTVTVAGGTTLEALNEALDSKGLALPSLGSISKQTVAGAISTGTHGTGLNIGSLSALVTALTLVDASGRVHQLSAADGDLFEAARVGLGALGVIVDVTMRVQPAFRLREVARAITFDEAVDSMDALAASARHVKLWWLPHTERVVVYAWEPTDEPATWGPGATRFWGARQAADRVVNTRVFPAMLGLGRLLPSSVPSANRMTQEHYLIERERVARSDRIFNLAMPPVHREMEYGIPAELASDGLRGVRKIIEDQGLRVNFIVEVRFVAEDSILLSGSHGRPSCQLGAYMAECADLASYFGHFEPMCLDMGGRPHWGKEFYASGEVLREVWAESWDRFVAVRASLDPEGSFDNALLRRVFSDGCPTG